MISATTSQRRVPARWLRRHRQNGAVHRCVASDRVHTGALLMLAVSWIFRRAMPGRVDRWFRRGQLLSCALYSLGHGSNDAQKTAGHHLAAADYCRHGHLGCADFAVLGCDQLLRGDFTSGHSSVAGALSRPWGRDRKLKPVGGFCADAGGAITLFVASSFGIPVSTIHYHRCNCGRGRCPQVLGRALGALLAALSGPGCSPSRRRPSSPHWPGGSASSCFEEHSARWLVPCRINRTAK